jgi:hypothetical protein
MSYSSEALALWTPQEISARVWRVNNLSWDAREAGEKPLKHLTDIQLSERNKALLDLVPPDGVTYGRNGFRIDDGYIEWLEKYGCEQYAISAEIRRRYHRR